jgi:hypothetical protein
MREDLMACPNKLLRGNHGYGIIAVLRGVLILLVCRYDGGYELRQEKVFLVKLKRAQTRTISIEEGRYPFFNFVVVVDEIKTTRRGDQPPLVERHEPKTYGFNTQQEALVCATQFEQDSLARHMILSLT